MHNVVVGQKERELWDYSTLGSHLKFVTCCDTGKVTVTSLSIDFLI